MACTLHVSWDEKLTGYDFGPQHPLAPIRVKLTMELAAAFGVLTRDQVTVAAAGPASDAELELVHDPRYIEVVRQAGELRRRSQRVRRCQHAAQARPRHRRRPDLRPHARGLGSGHRGDARRRASAVGTAPRAHAASIAGGLHHAMRASASGFCIYNDPAIAIAVAA